MRQWAYPLRDGRTVTIRHAELRDAAEMHRAFCSVVEEGKWLPTINTNSVVADWIAWLERVRKTREVILIAEIDSRYVGHLFLQPEEWHTSQHVARLGILVTIDYRGIGVGHSLMQAAEDAALDKSFRKIVLSTFDTNIVAKKLYEELGYRLVGIRYNQFLMPKGFIHEVLYEKELIPAIQQ